MSFLKPEIMLYWKNRHNRLNPRCKPIERAIDQTKGQLTLKEISSFSRNDTVWTSDVYLII